MVERLFCKEEVGGSNPPGSTDSGITVHTEREFHSCCGAAVVYGLWRSLVARSVRDGKDAGSNPVNPTSGLYYTGDEY